MAKGTIKKVEFKQFEAKSGDNKGRKFTKVIITVDVVTDAEKGYVQSVKGSLSLDYAKRYFEYCGMTSKSAIGKSVDARLQKRAYTAADGSVHTVTEARFINFLDEAGEPIIMPKEDEEKTPF